MKSMKKTIALAVAIAMIFGCVIGGTVAWLIDSTGKVENTFTVGNIDISLEETKDLNLKMVPGNKIAKDPKVSVQAGSEDCWLFVKIEKSANYDTYLAQYAVDETVDSTVTGINKWTPLSGVDGVYYREAKAGAEYQVLKGEGTDAYKAGYVTVNESVTKSQMDAITNGSATAPKLTFTAYAVQKDNIANAEAAWAQVTTTINNGLFNDAGANVPPTTGE